MKKEAHDPIRYSIDLSFEEIKLPPFQDILILGKHSQQGKIGLNKSFELMVPNGFEMVEIDLDGCEKVEAVFINKKILSKMPADKILQILRSKVFPYVSEGELLKVDFRVTLSYVNIEYEI
jgi:hypothetical protein